MGTLENTPFNSGIESLTVLAKEVKKKNILLYGLFIQYKKVCIKMSREKSVSVFCNIQVVFGL